MQRRDHAQQRSDPTPRSQDASTAPQITLGRPNPPRDMYGRATCPPMQRRDPTQQRRDPTQQCPDQRREMIRSDRVRSWRWESRDSVQESWIMERDAVCRMTIIRTPATVEK